MPLAAEPSATFCQRLPTVVTRDVVSTISAAVLGGGSTGAGVAVPPAVTATDVTADAVKPPASATVRTSGYVPATGYVWLATTDPLAPRSGDTMALSYRVAPGDDERYEFALMTIRSHMIPSSRCWLRIVG